MGKVVMEKSPFSKVDQVGVIVKDMDKAIEYYQDLGIGPFKPMGTIAVDRRVYGKPADNVKNLARIAHLGNVELELLQPISGESIQRQSLERHGEGIDHLGFFVDDIDKETARLVEKGFKVISSGKYVGGGGFALFDTDKVGGVLFELVQRPPHLAGKT